MTYGILLGQGHLKSESIVEQTVAEEVLPDIFLDKLCVFEALSLLVGEDHQFRSNPSLRLLAFLELSTSSLGVRLVYGYGEHGYSIVESSTESTIAPETAGS